MTKSTPTCRIQKIKTEVVIDRITSAATPRQNERVPAEATFGPLEMVHSLYTLDTDSEGSVDREIALFDAVLAGMELLEDDYLGGSGSRGSGKIAFRKLKVIFKSRKYYENPQSVPVITLAEDDSVEALREVRLTKSQISGCDPSVGRDFMLKPVTYYLNFRSSLHLGRRGVGLEETEISIPADTLFSAICQTWRTFYGEASLTNFLDQYETGEPFLLTSAFPFAGDVRFFPKPLIVIEDEIKDDDRKKFKNLRFVSEKRFHQIINNEMVASDHDDLIKNQNLINDKKIWIHDDDKGPPTVWKTDKRPRVTLDRQSSASEIWHLGGVKFNKGCGLWFDAKFETEETQRRIETILRVLGDTGIGGERSAGYGLFDFHSKSAESQPESEVNRFVTLSPICPRDADQLDALIQGDDVTYTLEGRSGWIGSAEGSGLRRQQIWMFGEGSVLSGSGAQVGRLVDLKPDSFSHPVWRYGYAWPIKI